jgi:peptidoglycan/LPS O-acetylase OafA/YrhL
LFPLAAVWTAALIEKSYGVQRASVFRGRASRSLVLIGTVSYSMYLLHQPLTKAWGSLIRDIAPAVHPLLVFLACVALLPLIVGLSWLSLVWIEKPSAAHGKYLVRRGLVTTTSTSAAG